MPEADGKITLRIDDNEAQVLFWALIGRIRECTYERNRSQNSPEQLNIIETEIVQLGALLEKLPTYKHKGEA